MKRAALLAAIAAALAVPTAGSAQEGGPGFLFRPPQFSLAFKAGYSWPRAGGDLFGFTRDEFMPLGADTLSSLDFDGLYLGGELTVRPWNRWDVAVGFGWTRSDQRTEYRRWEEDVGGVRIPIQQQTTLQIIEGTLGAKYYLQDRGRRVGTLAWVPNRFAPFVGGGIGVSSYEFEQVGDFVDTSTSAIDWDYLRTTGEGFLWYGSAGFELALHKHVFLTAEGRYSFSSANVGGSYVGFEGADVGGLQLTGGLGFQF